MLKIVIGIGATTLWDPWDASPPTFEQVGTVPPTFENFEVNKSPKCTLFGTKCSNCVGFWGSAPPPPPPHVGTYNAPPSPQSIGAPCLPLSRLLAFNPPAPPPPPV